MAKYFILEHFSFLSKLQKILSIYSWATLQSTLSAYCVKSVQTRSFFWSVFSCIWTEYGDILGKLSYSAQIQENTDQKNLCIWTLFTQWQSRRVLKTRCKVTVEKSSRINLASSRGKRPSLLLFHMDQIYWSSNLEIVLKKHQRK